MKNSKVLELLKQNLQAVKKQELQQASINLQAPARPSSANRIGMPRKPPKMPGDQKVRLMSGSFNSKTVANNFMKDIVIFPNMALSPSQSAVLPRQASQPRSINISQNQNQVVAARAESFKNLRRKQSVKLIHNQILQQQEQPKEVTTSPMIASSRMMSQKDFKIRNSVVKPNLFAKADIDKEIALLEEIQMPANSQDSNSDQIERKLAEWEAKCRVQDRFLLLAFGLRKKQNLRVAQMRQAVIKTVNKIKFGFRMVLSKYMEWKANKDIKQMQKLIENFDQGEDYKRWQKINAKKNPKLELILEEEEDQDFENSQIIEPQGLMTSRVKKFLEEQDKMEWEMAHKKKSVNIISRFLIQRKRQQEFRLMRLELAKLPFPCRRSYVKMFLLKFDTQRFKSEFQKFEQLN